MFFQEYTQVLKILFDIDSRHFSYNVELGVKERHEILFWASAPITFIILTINPFIHSIIYMTCMLMINVVDLNRILYYSILLSISKHFNLLSYRAYTKPDFITACKLLLVLVNYTDASTALPTLFQLISDFPDVYNLVLEQLLDVHSRLFKGDTSINAKLLNLKAFFVSHKNKIALVRRFLMILLALYSFYTTNVFSIVGLTFCYYATVTLADEYYTTL